MPLILSMTWVTAATYAARPRGRSELDLLRQRQGIVDFDPEVTDGALNLRMSEKQLNRPQITCLTVDLRRLGAAQRVRAIGAAVHSRARDPAMHDACVLARRKVRLILNPARKGVGASIRWSRVQPLLQRDAGLLHDLELNRSAGLVLDNSRSISHVAARRDVVDAEADEIAAAQLIVDGKIEQSEIALAVLNLKSDTNGPDLLRPKGTLLTNETSLVPCDPRRSAVCFVFGGHGRPPRPTAPTAAPAFSRLAIVSQPHRAAGTLSAR